MNTRFRGLVEETLDEICEGTAHAAAHRVTPQTCQQQQTYERIFFATEQAA
jgi:hypothetical protein